MKTFTSTYFVLSLFASLSVLENLLLTRLRFQSLDAHAWGRYKTGPPKSPFPRKSFKTYYKMQENTKSKDVHFWNYLYHVPPTQNFRKNISYPLSWIFSQCASIFQSRGILVCTHLSKKIKERWLCNFFWENCS